MTWIEAVPARGAGGGDRKSNEATSEAELVARATPIVHYLVADIARRIPRSVQRDDLVAAGMLGLVQAARSWNPDRGVLFEWYARTRIRGAILDELRRLDWATRSVRTEARQLRAAVDDLTRVLGREPTTAEVASRIGMDPTALKQLTDDVHRATVLSFDDVIVGEGDGVESMPAPSENPADVVLAGELRAYLADSIVALPERLRTVVVEYFFEGRQMQDIADDLGVTESRVSQMRSEALALLRDGINSQLEPSAVSDLGVTSGRVAKRKSAYYAAVAAASDARAYRARMASSLPASQLA